jgi:hypothetical protein
LSVRDQALREAIEVAQSMLGGAVRVSGVATRGRNSRIWQVRSGDRTFALKQYPPPGTNSRHRLAAEVGALRLMARYGIEMVPRIVGTDDKRGYVLLSWIDGCDVDEIDDADIDAAVAFLAAVHLLRTSALAREQPLAAEACLSGREIARQIAERLAQLRKGAPEERELIDFLESSFEPEFARASAEARQSTAAVGLDFDAELAQEWRSLIPSDFGFHNCLRRADATLGFVDFEYFGWDDPVKLTADILLHPGRPLALPQRGRFRQAALRLYGGDPGFASRLSAYLPLFGLRWVLIVLNEFIPERWQRRVLAGEAETWSDAKARQLARARHLMKGLPEKAEG